MYVSGALYCDYISCFIHHPILTTKNAYKDIKKYIKYNHSINTNYKIIKNIIDIITSSFNKRKNFGKCKPLFQSV